MLCRKKECVKFIDVRGIASIAVSGFYMFVELLSCTVYEKNQFTDPLLCENIDDNP